MAYYFKLTGIAFFLFFAGAPTPFAQSQWRYEDNQHPLRHAFIEQKSIVLGSTCSTRLQFNATRDRGKGITGILALEFTVSPMSSIKGFDFEYFEGPGAPVGAQKLMRVTVTKGGRPFIHTLSLVGYLGSESDPPLATTRTAVDPRYAPTRFIVAGRQELGWGCPARPAVACRLCCSVRLTAGSG